MGVIWLTAWWLAGVLPAASAGPAWARHTIDATSQGADGVRLADVNGDGWLDIATGWEEGGVIRVYVNPGPERAARPWPAVTVGRVASPEDAVLVDVDRDGAMDVVSCCEGRTRTVFVHWAPADPARWLDEAAWRTEAVPATRGRAMWMFALPLQVDGRGAADLVVGAKGDAALIGWLEAPADPRRLDRWRLRPLRPAGWIMSLRAWDMDGDGDQDVVASDRKGRRRGVFWLENPGPSAAAAGGGWAEHGIGGADHEVMFLDLADLDGDSRTDVLTATHSGVILWFRQAGGPDRWETRAIRNPFGLPNGKAVCVGDVDGDGRPDIVHSTEPGGDPSLPGVAWLQYRQSPREANWAAHDISGPEGVKFDRLELLDLDADGDLDVLACEERHNLGVFWYENPTVGAGR